MHFFVVALSSCPAANVRRGAQQPFSHFTAHVYCGQTAGWIRIPLDTDVGLGLGDIVLDGDPDPPTERGIAAPTFRSIMSTVAKRSPISATAELLVYAVKLL